MSSISFATLFKRAQKFLLSAFTNRIFFFAFLPVLVGAVFCFSLLLFNMQAVARGVTLAGTPVDMLSYGDLSSVVQQKTATFSASPLAIVLPNGIVKRIPLETLGARIDAQQTTNKVFFTSRKSNPLFNSFTQLRALFEGINIPYQETVNESTLSHFIESDLAQFNHPAQNATPAYDPKNNSFVLQTEQSGIIIDRQQFESDLRDRLAHLSSQEITLHQRDDFPEVSYANAHDAQTQANNLLTRLPLVLQYSDGNISVKQGDVIAWTNFIPDAQMPTKLTLSFDRQKIQDYLTLLFPGLNKEPLDARFRMENNRVVAFQLSQEGQSLNVQQSATNIIQALAQASASPPTATLAFTKTDPAVTSANIENLGITKLLATGTTDFSGSHKSRITNIEIGSQKYEGLLIAPGEEFSFDKILGDVGAQQGYLPELVIKKGMTVPEYGGGLCQVSTTMFRTAILAGLQITERYNHAYVVKYYGTPGFDATIYPPHPDLKFINNTPGYILIQHQIVGTKLSFEMYGTDDGRKVKVDGPYVYDKQPDGSMKAVLTQTVFDAQGNTMFQKKIYSNYAPASLYPIPKNPLE